MSSTRKQQASQLRFEIKTYLQSSGSVDSPFPHKVHRLLRRKPSPCFRAAMTGPIRSARLRSEPSISHRWTPRVSSTCFQTLSKLQKQNPWTKPSKTYAIASERKSSVMPACSIILKCRRMIIPILPPQGDCQALIRI